MILAPDGVSELCVCLAAVQAKTIIWISLPGQHTQGIFIVSLCAPSFGQAGANLCYRTAPNPCNEAATYLSITFHPAFLSLP